MRGRARVLGATLGCPSNVSLDELLAIEADAVAVLAPPRAHAELVDAALAAGRHVLCAKRSSVTLQEPDRMGTLSARRKSGVQLAVHAA